MSRIGNRTIIVPEGVTVKEGTKEDLLELTKALQQLKAKSNFT